MNGVGNVDLLQRTVIDDELRQLGTEGVTEVIRPDVIERSLTSAPA